MAAEVGSGRVIPHRAYRRASDGGILITVSGTGVEYSVTTPCLSLMGALADFSLRSECEDVGTPPRDFALSVGTFPCSRAGFCHVCRRSPQLNAVCSFTLRPDATLHIGSGKGSSAPHDNLRVMSWRQAVHAVHVSAVLVVRLLLALREQRACERSESAT
jgi:hypothetical protein